MNTQLVSKLGIKAGNWFAWAFKLGLMFLFMCYLLISAIAIGIETKDFGEVVKQIGREFYDPLVTASEYAIEIHNNPPKNILESFWGYWGFYFAIYKIFLWIKVIMFLIINPLLKDSNSPLIRFIFAALIFFFTQIIYGVLFLNHDINFFFSSILNIITGIISLISSSNFSYEVSSFNINDSDIKSCLNSTCIY